MQGIACDAAYAGCIARDLRDASYASYSPVVSLCVVPYFSLFVHESLRKLEGIDPTLAAVLSNDVRSIVERSRHSLKLFEDTHRGIDGQVVYFRDEVLPTHHSHFVERVWFPPARRFAKNLGIFSYDKRPIMNTHAATFHMGIATREQLEMQGAEVRAIYERYGRYFGRVGASLDATSQTFVSSLNPQLFNQTEDDVRYEAYYPSVFNGAATPDLNAVLTVFRGMMNFVDSVMVAGRRPDSIEYSVFKVRFLTLYGVIGSLQRLRDEQAQILTHRSVSFIDRISGTAEAQLIMNRSAKPFRNTLMHYNLHSSVDTSRVDMSDPLFGLALVYFPAYDPANFAEAVDRCISETAATMEEWAAA
jgi:hypothetical protein